jgi:dienelactone hydrolase
MSAATCGTFPGYRFAHPGYGLRSRRDVVPHHVFLQGWSNGGSTTLNTMIRQGSNPGFRAALAFYPGCGRAALLEETIRTTAPIALLMGDADQEVSPEICSHVAERSYAAGTRIEATFYAGATHDFDDPGEKRQEMGGNAAAKAAAMAKAASVIDGFNRQP